MNELRIGWLFPDTLYLHGERGNVLALERFAKLEGLNTVVDKIDFTVKNFDPMEYDILFCPPGEITSFNVVMEWLKPYYNQIINFVESGRPLIVTGTSVAMWCKGISRQDGTKLEGFGLVNANAYENENVYGDDNYFHTSYNGKDIDIIGNQIQMVDFQNEGAETFGQLIYGYGNNGKNREEGFKINNSIFTNTLGPMLITNPGLTIEIIKVAIKNKGINEPNIEFDMELENMSFATKKEFILSKVTRLTNCK